MTDSAGYSWTRPVEAGLTVTTGDGDLEVPFRFVYSTENPHLELIEAVPGTLWTAGPAGAAHHLGYWVDDLQAAARDLESAGYRIEARPAGDTLTTFAYLVDPEGVRIELVDRAMFPDWPGFLKMMQDPG